MLKKERPYIYDFYNVRCFIRNPLSDVKNVLTRLVNALVKVLNEATKLPRFIRVIPNQDIVTYIKRNWSSKHCDIIANIAVKWIINVMVKAVSTKKDMLSRVKPGAVEGMEPKIVWVKMLRRPQLNKSMVTSEFRWSFNRSLEHHLTDRKLHYIIDPTAVVDDPGLFTNIGLLNNGGKLKFWSYIDEHIQQFAKKTRSLVPINPDVIQL